MRAGAGAGGGTGQGQEAGWARGQDRHRRWDGGRVGQGLPNTAIVYCIILYYLISNYYYYYA